MNAQVISACSLLAMHASGVHAVAERGPEAAAQEIQAYLDSLAAENRFSGAILVAKDGQPIAGKAAGLANRETNTPNTIETKFNLGSLNKMFTAVAIGQLAQKGRLKFEDTMGKHLPDYPNKAIAEKVTIHHLLTHTSGMGLYWNEKFAAQRTQLTSVAAHLPLFVNDPLAFSPGEKFQYSNSGFMVLGAIIEKLSGRSYYDYVRDNVYKPAGMANTGFYEPGREIADLAVGYTKMDATGRRGETEHPNTDLREVKGGPAGGGFSTVGDLLKFSIALRSNKLLDEQHTKLLTTGKVDDRMGKYGYGFGDRVVGGKRIVGHNGGSGGIAANLDIFPDLGYIAIALMNADPPVMFPVVKNLQELIPAS